MLGNPPVLILDEPTVGLDPKQIIEVRNLIKALGKKHTVIFSSHILSEVAAICDRVIVIANGRIVADAKTNELSTVLSGKGQLIIEAEGSASTITSAVNEIYGVKKVTKQGNCRYSIDYDSDVDIRKSVFNALSKNGCVILEMREGGLSLEESFLQLTSQAPQKGGKSK